MVGYGEAKAHVGSKANGYAIVPLIEKELGAMLIGQDARQISRLWDVMYNADRAHFAIARGRGFPHSSNRGLWMSGMSGVDLALWELLGKSLGVPVWQLLGGRRHERMQAYASGGWAPAGEIAAELQGSLDRGGFKAVKMRVGAGDGNVGTSIARVKAARAGLGDDIQIMCDAHGTFSVTEAKRFCREVTDCNIDFLEEPVSSDDHQGLAEVRASTDVPIATGESEYTRFAFLDLADRRAADIFQPDLSVTGGITEGIRIEAIAAAYGLRTATHHWGGPITFMSGVHLAASSTSGFIIEYPSGASPILDQLAVEDFPVTDGFVDIPERPGFGVTIDEEFVAKSKVEI